MSIITCTHPSNKIKIKQEQVKTTDILLKYEKPRAYCTDCDCYLPEDKKVINIMNVWFIKQDDDVQAVLSAA